MPPAGRLHNKPRPRQGHRGPGAGCNPPDAQPHYKTRCDGGSAALPTAPTPPTRRQTPPEGDLLPEPGSPGPTPGASADDTTTGTGPVAAAHGAADFGIDLDWLPEPGRTQAMSGRAADGDIRRCAYHLAPLGCILVDGDADEPGLIELYGHKSEGQSDGTTGRLRCELARRLSPQAHGRAARLTQPNHPLECANARQTQ